MTPCHLINVAQPKDDFDLLRGFCKMLGNDYCFAVDTSQALFRALKTKGNTPKYGIIYHSTFIGRAAAKNKGRISRVLANKCAIASRIDR